LDEKKKGEYINMIMKDSGQPVPEKCPEKCPEKTHEITTGQGFFILYWDILV
jgi:hypothetical protein